MRVWLERRVFCAPNRGRLNTRPWPGKRRSGLAGVGGLERSSRLLLGLVGGTVAHQSHLVRCRLLARDGALFAAGALDDVVLGRECRRGDDSASAATASLSFMTSSPSVLRPTMKVVRAGSAGGRRVSFL